MINTMGNQSKAAARDEEESYEVLEMSEDAGLVKQENTKDDVFVNIDQRDLELEILSNIDPNDEFLQSEKSFSLIDGVSSNE